ncbi:hypothetical protein FOIG_02226 [Fusarium odoratissimum NRRL 54006]|uniref:Uncharacterized protein n=1 Tax=Fusarium odoratissimum (strain NRRL 54006) TaxID=1089451 RepID=X0K748_FUSO5|nr:uncharacterized protein FOIG_02226 [Fusarium odoratissimum NRRL 54006]EXM09379.1 hypothetical protein FOIG_02226 [Fusarium odoratissimum NRRL 54006]
MDENDAKHRRERSRKAAKAGTETHRRAEPALTWTGLTQAGYCDGISTQSGGDNSVTAPIHGDSQSCGPRIRTGIMGRGASPTRRAGVVGYFLGFPLIQTDSDCSRSLAHQDRLCCPNRSRVSPTLLIGAGTTNSGSSHAPPCQTLCSPPVGLFSSNPTQPPTLA